MRRLLAALALALLPLAAAALAADPKPPSVRVSGPEAAIELPAGGAATVRIKVEVAKGYHVYGENKSDYIAISFAAREAELRVAGVKLPPAHPVKFPSEEQPIPVHEGTFDAEVAIAGGAGWAEGAEKKVGIVVGYQACTDEFCEDPKKVTVEVAVKVGKAAPPSAPTVTPDKPVESKGVNKLWQALLALGAGLLVTLTPCVYPLIPVTVTYFDQQSGGSRAKAISMAIAYGAGIVCMYAPLGVVMARLGRDVGSVLGNVYVSWGFVALFVALALSMFGLYELQLPSGLLTRLQSGERSGAIGAFVLGLTLGLVAAPCTGPVMGGMMAIVAQTGDMLFGLLAFGGFGLGVALPFMVLGIFSGGLGSIPRAGEWMEHVKHVFGYVLIAFAINFVYVATGSTALCFALLGAWCLAAGAAAQRSEPVLVRALAIALIAPGIYFLFGPYVLKPDGPITPPAKLFESSIAWQEDHDAALAAAKKAGKPAIVDFTARWCNACHELDFTTWRDAAVGAELKRFVAVKVDVTTDEHNQRIKNEVYKAFAIPYIAVYDSAGNFVASLPREGSSGIHTEDVLKLLKETR